MADYASLVLLTYHRPEFTDRTLTSLKAARNKTPYELIVVDDGSRDANWPLLVTALREREISTLIVNAGENLGVGTGINRGFQVATGKYLVKLDADLLYSDGWLDAGVALLEADPKIATVGFFDYRNYVADDTRFNRLGPVLDGNGKTIGHYVDDYVGSAFMLRRWDFLTWGIDVHDPAARESYWRGFPVGSAAFAEDVEWKNFMTKNGLRHAITDTDMIQNFGFGVGNSTVVPSLDQEGKAVVQKIATEPLIFPGGARA